MQLQTPSTQRQPPPACRCCWWRRTGRAPGGQWCCWGVSRLVKAHPYLQRKMRQGCLCFRGGIRKDSWVSKAGAARPVGAGCLERAAHQRHPAGAHILRGLWTCHYSSGAAQRRSRELRREWSRAGVRWRSVAITPIVARPSTIFCTRLMKLCCTGPGCRIASKRPAQTFPKSRCCCACCASLPGSSATRCELHPSSSSLLPS